MPQEYRQILKYADEPGYTPDLECYLRHGGYEALKKALALQPKTLPDGQDGWRAGATAAGSHGLRPAGPGRRRFLVRAEVVVR